jgi:hypothetical protein
MLFLYDTYLAMEKYLELHAPVLNLHTIAFSHSVVTRRTIEFSMKSTMHCTHHPIEATQFHLVKGRVILTTK